MTSLFSPSNPSHAGTSSFRSVDVIIRWHSGTARIPYSRGISTRGGWCISPPSFSRVVAGTGAGAISIDYLCRGCSDVNGNFIGTRKALKQLKLVKANAKLCTTGKKLESDSDIHGLDTEGESKKVMDVLGDVLEKVERLEHEELGQTPGKKINVAPLQSLGMPNIKHQSGRLANSVAVQTVGMPMRKQEEADSDINRLDTEGESKRVLDVLGDVLEKIGRLEHEKLGQTSKKKVNIAPLQSLGMPNIKHQSGRLANSVAVQTVGMPMRKQEEAGSDVNRLGIEGESKKVLDVLGDVLEKVERLEHEKLGQTLKKKVNRAPLRSLGMPNIKHQSGRLANSVTVQTAGMPQSVWRKGDPIPCRSNVLKDSLDVLKVESNDSRGIESKRNLEVPLEDSSRICGLSVSAHSQIELKKSASVSMQQFEGMSDGIASVPLHSAQSREGGAVNDCRYKASLTVAQMGINAQPKVSIAPEATQASREACNFLKPSVIAPPALVQRKTQTGVSISASPDELKPSVASHLESRHDVKSARNQANQAASVAGRMTNGHTHAIFFTKSDENSHLVKFKAEDEKENSEKKIHTKKEENGLEGTDERMLDFSSSLPRPVVSRVKKISKVRRSAEMFKKDNDNKTSLRAEILEVGAQGMLVKDLAADLAISEGEILRQLYSKGVMPDGVQMLDATIVKIICNDYGVEVIDEVPGNVGQIKKNKDILDGDGLESRPPVLTIMGHVDHGKTTLLDHIRKSKVVSSEAGGITQRIGAYNVMIPVDGKLRPCVFLDTPGHEAFAAMRARGTRITDIAVIVVAADDGVKRQTNEAITHAKTAGVPIIIAINKMDKDGANPERVMEQLLSIGLTPEDYGGDVPVVQISALKGDNVDDLMEIIMLVAELQELKANPHCEARGIVIEAGLDKSKGPTTTLLVQNGTLRRSDIIVCGSAFGKVRSLFDDDQRCVDQAGPSSPVQVIGLNGVPVAGDAFGVVRSLDVARKMAAVRAEELRNERISARAADGKVTMSSIASAAAGGALGMCELNVILKVNLQGSIGAIRQALQMLPQNNVCVRFLVEGTGDVTASDIDLAFVSRAIVLGFDVHLPSSVRRYAERRLVEIRLYRIIYDLIDDVRRCMEGLLRPLEEDVGIGSAQVRAVFGIGSSHVAGCIVTDGRIISGCRLHIYRRDQILHTAPLHSLRFLKEDVKEVASGGECGIGIKDFHDWRVGDILHAFTTVRKMPSLEDAAASVSATLQSFRS